MVNYQQKIQSIKKYIKKINKQKIYMIVLGVCLISIVGFYLGNDFNKETIITKESFDEQQIEDNKSQAKMVYSVDKDLATIRNPFTFAHEEREQETINKKIDIEDKNINNNTSLDKTSKKEINRDFTPKQQLKSSATINYKLKAIFNFGQGPVALLNINDEVYRVHQGEKVKGVKILSIENKKIVLQQEDGSIINCSLIAQ